MSVNTLVGDLSRVVFYYNDWVNIQEPKSIVRDNINENIISLFH